MPSIPARHFKAAKSFVTVLEMPVFNSVADKASARATVDGESNLETATDYKPDDSIDAGRFLFFIWVVRRNALVAGNTSAMIRGKFETQRRRGR